MKILNIARIDCLINDLIAKGESCPTSSDSRYCDVRRAMHYAMRAVKRRPLPVGGHGMAMNLRTGMPWFDDGN